MSVPARISAARVRAATCTAVLPVRPQYPRGIALLIAAPLLIASLGLAHGFWVGLLALAAFVSMSRNALLHFAFLGVPAQ